MDQIKLIQFDLIFFIQFNSILFFIQFDLILLNIKFDLFNFTIFTSNRLMHTPYATTMHITFYSFLTILTSKYRLTIL